MPPVQERNLQIIFIGDTGWYRGTMNPSFAVNIIAKSFARRPRCRSLPPIWVWGLWKQDLGLLVRKQGKNIGGQKINLPVLDAQQIVEDLLKDWTQDQAGLCESPDIFDGHDTSVHDIVRVTRRGVHALLMVRMRQGK